MTNIQTAIPMALEVNDVLFKTLLDNLYSNVHESVFRELIANAVDSQKSVNVLDPIKIQIPSTTYPQFIIRDYGSGLSPEDVIKYLNTLLSSGKKGLEYTVGQFGLGSKAILVLVSEYNINSYFNGIKYKFRFVRENSGIPELIHIGEEPTEEKNGLEYIVNFSSEDNTNICGFQNAIKSTFLRYLDFPFIIYRNIQENILNEPIPVPKLISSFNEDVHFYERIHHNDSHFVRVAGIVYPVHFNLLRSFSNNIVIVIDVDGRYFDFPVNRESLIINDKYYKGIKSIETSTINLIQSTLLTYLNQFKESNNVDITLDNLKDSNYVLDYKIALQATKLFYDNYGIWESNFFGLGCKIQEKQTKCLFRTLIHGFHFSLDSAYSINSGIHRIQVEQNYYNSSNDYFIIERNESLTSFRKYYNNTDKNYNFSQYFTNLNSDIIYSKENAELIVSLFIQYFPVKYNFTDTNSIKSLFKEQKTQLRRQQRTDTPKQVVGIRKLSYDNIRNNYSFSNLSVNQIANLASPIQAILSDNNKSKPFSSEYLDKPKCLILTKTPDKYQSINTKLLQSLTNQPDLNVLIIQNSTRFEQVLNRLTTEGIIVYTIESLFDYFEFSIEFKQQHRDLMKLNQIVKKLTNYINNLVEIFPLVTLKLLEVNPESCWLDVELDDKGRVIFPVVDITNLNTIQKEYYSLFKYKLLEQEIAIDPQEIEQLNDILLEIILEQENLINFISPLHVKNLLIKVIKKLNEC